MSDRDQSGEQFDDEVLAGEYPPDRPLGADDPDAANEEGDSLAERDRRTEPEARRSRARDSGEPVVESGVPPTDDGEEVLVPVDEESETGPLAPDDEFSGDETTRDVATERTPRPAEEAAMHVEDETEQ